VLEQTKRFAKNLHINGKTTTQRHNTSETKLQQAGNCSCTRAAKNVQRREIQRIQVGSNKRCLENWLQ